MASSTSNQSTVDPEINKIENLVEQIEIKDSDQNAPENNLEQKQEPDDKKPNLNTPNRVFISKLLNRNMKIEITDGRVLIGNFLCTDKDANIILGCCQEYIDSSKYVQPFQSVFQLIFN